MSWRVRYIPDEILAIIITATIAFSTIVLIVNVTRIIVWIQSLPWEG